MTTVADSFARRAGAGPDLSGPVLVAAALFLAGLIGLPIGWIAAFAFSDRDGAPTLANFIRLLEDPTLSEPLTTTLALSCCVAALAALTAAPLAWMVARTDMPGRRVARVLMTASFVTPPFLGAIAWEILAAPNSGILNRLWRDLTGAADPLFDVYSFGGLVFVIACYTAPYVFVVLSNALDRIPADLEDAAGILGAPRWRIVLGVTLPLALPALLAGTAVAFLQAMTLFGSPAILAIPAGFHTITTKIYTLFQFPPKPQIAAAAALPLLLVTIALLWLQARILGRRGYAVIGGKGSAPRPVRLGAWRWPACLLVFALLALPLFLPYMALLKAAISRLPAGPFDPANLTLAHVAFVFLEFSQTRDAFANTFLLALSTASAGSLLALVVAYVAARRADLPGRALEFLAMAPIAIPGVVLGVGLFLAYTRGPVVLYGTLWILFLAFLTIELPAAFQQLRAAFRGLHPELEEASRILGAGRLQTLRRITAPLLKGGVIAGWCLIFIGTVRELSAAVMLSSSTTKVLSVVIFDLNESGNLGAIAVIGVAMLLVTFAVVGFANWLTGAAGGARPQPT
ncbi:MAG: iron ABC transporter permease [Alphaproteobacteria bacterium]|nr:iron ABC transporter permease [Alphaproteobacteria bacterium]